jgi:chemotaxis protein CheC
MTTPESLEKRRIAVLQQLFASATHEASAAMCQWTDRVITLTLDDVFEVALEDVCEALHIGEELLTMVVLSLDDQFGGSMVLAFDDVNGRQLAASLIGADSDPTRPWSELEISALNETGNILGCTYVNALTRLLNCQLIPSTPYFIQDYGASVVQQAVLGQATSDMVLLCRTGFHHQEHERQRELSWWVLFVPSLQLRQALENAIGSDDLALATGTSSRRAMRS